jgi:hypothetical protein
VVVAELVVDTDEGGCALLAALAPPAPPAPAALVPPAAGPTALKVDVAPPAADVAVARLGRGFRGFLFLVKASLFSKVTLHAIPLFPERTVGCCCGGGAALAAALWSAVVRYRCTVVQSSAIFFAAAVVPSSCVKGVLKVNSAVV